MPMTNLHEIPFKKIGLGILIIILDIAAICLMINYGNPKVVEIGYDTIKLSIQLLLVVLFGGIFIQEYNRARAKKTARNEFRRDFMKILSRVYSDVKGVRRIIRAKCQQSIENNKEVDPRDFLPLAIYDENIASINSSKVELEILLRELKIVSEVFEETDKLKSGIERMEKYLKNVIEEYEKNTKKHRIAGSIPLEELPRLNAMIDQAKSETGDFKSFAESFYDTLTIIQKERIKIA